MNTFERAFAGDPISIPADTWNAIIEVAKAHRRGEPGFGGGEAGEWDNGFEVLVKNTSGAAVAQFGILGLGSATILPSVSLPTFQDRRLLDAPSPASSAPFVVLLEPLAANSIGRAVVLGLVPVKLTVTAAGDAFAGPTTSTSELTTNPTSGPAYVVYKEAGTGAGKWGLVLLLGQSGGSGTRVEVVEPFNSGVTPPAGLIDERVLYLNLNTLAFDVGESIWVKDANA